MTVVSPGVIDGNRVMTLLNGRPAATFVPALICIQMCDLFVSAWRCVLHACLCTCVRACRRTTTTSFSLSGRESASAHSSPVMCAHVYVAAGVCWPRIGALVAAGGEKLQPEWLCIDMRTQGPAHVTRCQLANWFLSSGLTELTSPL